VHTESTGSGFVNIFVRPAAAAKALEVLRRWVAQNVTSEPMHEDVRLWVRRNCSDHKLRSAYSVWQVLHASCEQSGSLAGEEKNLSLELLTEPEEFAVCLLLHEFPQKLGHGIPSGYLYQLAVRVRDGFFWRGRVAPFWLDDSENLFTAGPRRFLLALCEMVLRTGVLAHFQRQRMH
ncbi:MAG: hypothetical protein ACP5QZ_12300, partial [Candidatus Sumerlaeaceae bacterium]